MAECPPLLSPETEACSGRGTCLSATACACPDGWIGNGDFAFGTPSCATSVIAIQTLWAMVGILHFGTMFFSGYYIKVKLNQKRNTNAPLILGVLTLIANCAMCVTGITRAADPTRTIGSDPLVTTFFCIGSASFWSSAHVFIYTFLEFSIRQARMGRNEETHKLLMHLKLSLPVSNVASFIACMLPFGMLGATDATQVQQLATSHYVILALELFVTGGVLTPHFISKILRDINDAISKNPSKGTVLNQIVKKMQRFRAEFRNQVISNVIFAALFGFWPFLQVYGSSYFLPFAWASGAFVIILALILNLPVSEKKSSNTGTGTGNTGEKTSSIRPQSGTSPETANSVVLGTHMMTVLMDESHFDGSYVKGDEPDDERTDLEA